jgi:hypothetical protein
MILVYPLTHSSLLLRAAASGREPDIVSFLVLLAYTVFFFYLAGRTVKRTT